MAQKKFRPTQWAVLAALIAVTAIIPFAHATLYEDREALNAYMAAKQAAIANGDSAELRRLEQEGPPKPTTPKSSQPSVLSPSDALWRRARSKDLENRALKEQQQKEQQLARELKEAQAKGREAATQGGFYIEYVVSGSSSSASLSYSNEGGGTEQRDVRLPWSKNFVAAKGSHLYISAQNDSTRDESTVIVEIKVNGVAVKRSEAEGKYKIASASGRL